MSNKELDPYTAKAENNNISPQDKITGLHGIVKNVKTGMLTTRSVDGYLHSRAMAPVGREFLAHRTHLILHPINSCDFQPCTL